MRVDTASFTVDGLALEQIPRWRPTVTDSRTPRSSPVDQLTDGQRDCLRLVYNHMTSKDIARKLNVSPHTVDMRLRTAMKTLAVGSRIEAARMLVQVEGEGYQTLIYHPSELPGGGESAEMDAPASRGSGEQATPADLTPDSLVTGPPAFGPPRTADASVRIHHDRPGIGLPDPEVGTRSLVHSLPYGDVNNLSVGARLAWILIIAIGSALAFGALLSALAALKNLI